MVEFFFNEYICLYKVTHSKSAESRQQNKPIVYTTSHQTLKRQGQDTIKCPSEYKCYKELPILCHYLLCVFLPLCLCKHALALIMEIRGDLFLSLADIQNNACFFLETRKMQEKLTEHFVDLTPSPHHTALLSGKAAAVIPKVPAR